VGCVHVGLGFVQQPHARLSNTSHGNHMIAENFELVENDPCTIFRSILRATSRQEVDDAIQ
jgi:hypothetical protein